MALNIKSTTADRLARALAEETGETLTEAVTKALEERLRRCRRQGDETRRLALREIRERVSALPSLTEQTDDEILGYDANGTFS